MENFDLLNEALKIWLISAREIITTETAKQVSEAFEDYNAREKIYSATEICKICNISIATLNRWIKNGLYCSNTGNGTKRFFTIKDIEKYKKENRTNR